MGPALSLAFCAALLLGVGAARGPDGHVPARVEAFGLFAPGTSEAVGWARLVRSELGGVFEVELEFCLFAQDVVVHQVEREGPDQVEVIYRERRPGAGRTQRSTWRRAGQTWESERVEWAGRERLGRLGKEPPPATLLRLSEAARTAPARGGDCYWPTSDRVERLGAKDLGPALRTGPRFAAWTDERGAVRAWRLYAAGELLAFGWSEGGAVAQRVSPAELEALRARPAGPDLVGRR